MSEYQLNTGKIGEKVVDAYEKVEKKFTDTFLNEDGSMKTGKIGDAVTGAYQKIEDGVVGTYKKVEDGVVGAYKKVEDAFVDTFLEKKDDKKAEDNKEAQKYEGGISNAALLCICFIR